MQTPTINVKSVEYWSVLLKANKLNFIAENNPRYNLNIDSKLDPL